MPNRNKLGTVFNPMLHNCFPSYKKNVLWDIGKEKYEEEKYVVGLRVSEKWLERSEVGQERWG